MLLNKLKTDINRMIELSQLIGIAYQKTLYCGNTLDELNYNTELHTDLQKKIVKMQNELDELKHKWI